jgi:hypothetical protein
MVATLQPMNDIERAAIRRDAKRELRKLEPQLTRLIPHVDDERALCEVVQLSSQVHAARRALDDPAA